MLGKLKSCMFFGVNSVTIIVYYCVDSLTAWHCWLNLFTMAMLYVMICKMILFSIVPLLVETIPQK